MEIREVQNREEARRLIQTQYLPELIRFALKDCKNGDEPIVFICPFCGWWSQSKAQIIGRIGRKADHLPPTMRPTPEMEYDGPLILCPYCATHLALIPLTAWNNTELSEEMKQLRQKLEAGSKYWKKFRTTGQEYLTWRCFGRYPYGTGRHCVSRETLVQFVSTLSDKHSLPILRLDYCHKQCLAGWRACLEETYKKVIAVNLKAGQTDTQVL